MRAQRSKVHRIWRAKDAVFDAADIRGRTFELSSAEDFDHEWIETNVNSGRTRN